MQLRSRRSEFCSCILPKVFPSMCGGEMTSFGRQFFSQPLEIRGTPNPSGEWRGNTIGKAVQVPQVAGRRLVHTPPDISHSGDENLAWILAGRIFNS